MRVLHRSLPVLLVAGKLFSGPADAAPGSLDPSFYSTGWKILPGTTNGSALGLARQNDGGVIVTGVEVGTSVVSALYTARLLPDGSLDTGFHLSPPAFPDPDTHSRGHAAAVQPDGRILIAGSFSIPSRARSGHFLLRSHTDGSPDPSFGGGAGYVTLTGNGPAVAMAVQSDGRIVLAADAGKVVRYQPDGTLDTAFGTGGLVPETYASMAAIALQSDGKILIAKKYDPGPLVMRLNPDGTPDAAFGNNPLQPGNAIVPMGQPPGTEVLLFDVAVQPDGRILVSGSWGGNSSRPWLARLLSDGSPDLSFNGTGRISMDFGELAGPQSAKISLEANGRILVTGSVNSLASDLFLARFLTDGTPDPRFGAGGQVRTDLAGSRDQCRASLLLPGGKLVMAGYFHGESIANDGILLARYNIVEGAELTVEQPAGITRDAASTQPLDFGLITLGSRTKEFVLRNTGSETLTNISVSLSTESPPGEYMHSQPPSSLAPGARSTFLVSLTPSAEPGPRTAGLHIASSDPLSNPFIIPLTGRRATPHEVWRVTWFGFADNSGPGADLNDFDGDGLVNFMEYATAGNPHRPAGSSAAVTVNGAQLEYTWTRPAAALAEFNYQPEASSTPAGPWSGNGLTSVIAGDDGTLQTVRITTPVDSSRRFFRLRITRR